MNLETRCLGESLQGWQSNNTLSASKIPLRHLASKFIWLTALLVLGIKLVDSLNNQSDPYHNWFHNVQLRKKAAVETEFCGRFSRGSIKRITFAYIAWVTWEAINQLFMRTWGQLQSDKQMERMNAYREILISHNTSMQITWTCIFHACSTTVMYEMPWNHPAVMESLSDI